MFIVIPGISLNRRSLNRDSTVLGLPLNKAHVEESTYTKNCKKESTSTMI